MKHCLACGIVLTRRVRPSGNREAFTKFKRRKHCSNQCRLGREPQPLPPATPCPRCGVLSPRGQKFCSRTCRDASYVRVPVTKKQGRNQAQKRFRPQPCERCGTTESIHRHHRDEDPTNNAPSNIGFFCAGCHGELHSV